jgi:hypothetical protein
MKFFKCCLVFLIALSRYGYADESTRNYSIIPKAEIIQESPLKVKISCVLNNDSINLRIWKKKYFAEKWTLIFTSDQELSYIDTNIVSGMKYEYKFENDYDKKNTAFGYLAFAHELTAPAYRGALLIIIDDKVQKELKDDIERFRRSIIADGYKVWIRSAPRTETFDTNNIKITKKIIDNFADSNKFDNLLFFGRIAAPYAGADAVDGHGDHLGAWPCDVCYGLNSVNWPDSMADAHSAADIRNQNIPYDGKYDNQYIDDSVRIAIGRVDFYNLPVFSKTEIELYKNYIQKNIDYRNAKYKAEPKYLIDDRFKTVYQEMIGAEAWINFSALAEPNNVSQEEYLKTSLDSICQISYACNAGSYNSVMNIIYSDDFANKKVNGVISEFMGSYLGDWDSKNNLLRSAIATDAGILNSFFGGRPFWYLHKMSLGESIGDAYKLSINNSNFYNSTCLYGFNMLHIALMGDPTTRINIAPPPENLKILKQEDKIEFTWTKPQGAISCNYNIYQSDSLGGDFVKINNAPISDETFTLQLLDKTPKFYLVKTLVRRSDKSGTRYEESVGKYFNEPSGIDFSEQVGLEIIPNGDALLIKSDKELINIAIYDILGNEIIKSTSANGEKQIELRSYAFNMKNQAFIIKALFTDGKTKTNKLIIY